MARQRRVGRERSWRFVPAGGDLGRDRVPAREYMARSSIKHDARWAVVRITAMPPAFQYNSRPSRISEAQAHSPRPTVGAVPPGNNNSEIRYVTGIPPVPWSRPARGTPTDRSNQRRRHHRLASQRLERVLPIFTLVFKFALVRAHSLCFVGVWTGRPVPP